MSPVAIVTVAAPMLQLAPVEPVEDLLVTGSFVLTVAIPIVDRDLPGRTPLLRA
jgi:hypothetical protein